MRLGGTVTAALAILLTAPVPAPAQESWKPSKPVTLIAPNAPGGTSDRTARELQRLFQKYKLVDVTVNVVNRPGGGGSLALNQLHSSAGDPHVLLITTSAVISNHITGLQSFQYTDFSPIALLLGDNYGVNVRADSPIRSAREMLDQVRKNPEALTFGMSSVGGTNHTSLVAALKKGGVDVRRVKMVTFAGGGVISLQLLGGHVDVINTGLGNMADHMVQGRMRTLAITGPRRMGGVFADVPTWKEVGVDVSLIGWRGILGARALAPAQVAYWDDVFRKIVQTEDWKADLQKNYWLDIYANAAGMRKWLDAENSEVRALLTDLGMAK